MIIDNNPFYIVAKKFDEIGCIAYKCKNMNEARNVPIRCKQFVQKTFKL